MAKVSVTVNGLTLVHRDSGATSTATLPDVCATPPGGALTPYPNVAEARDLRDGSCAVRADGGNEIAIAGSIFARSAGDEPGTGGGVTSGTTGAEAALLSHSFDVAVEGRGVARLTDKMLHNHGNTIDCAGLQLAHPAGTADGGSPLELRLQDRSKKLMKTETVIHARRGCDTNLGGYLDPKTGKQPGAAPPGWPSDKPWPPPPSHGKRPKLGAAWLHERRHMTFVGRYISEDLGGHFRLSGEELRELHAGGLDVFLIWEVSKYQALCKGNTADQRRLGEKDAHDASAWLEKIGQGKKNRVVYFTCDFPTHAYKAKNFGADSLNWGLPPPVPPPPQPWVAGQTSVGELIEAYFEGIKKQWKGIERVGVYGSHQTISTLLDKPLVKYAWQFAFPPEPPAGPDGKLPTPPSKFPFGKQKHDHRAHLLQYQIYTKASQFPYKNIRVHPAAGWLDLDSAIKKDFGQFGPNTPGSL
jgi:Domain of unknown function (DUF4150)/Domain of unknown function (DUF1906)